MSTELEPATPSVHQSFDFADSDITLSSADGVYFRVHKANLAACSVTFRNMLQDGTPADNDIPALSEDSATLAIVFSMCYPLEDPPIDFGKLEPSVVLACYAAVVKYQMWVAGLALRSFVEPLVHIDPFQVIHCAHSLNDSVLMTKAAIASLEFDILPQSDNYRHKTGIMWPNILEYHYRNKILVIEGLLKFSDLAANESEMPNCNYNYCRRQVVYPQQGTWKLLLKKLLASPISAWPAKELKDYAQTCVDASSPIACPMCSQGSYGRPVGWSGLLSKVEELRPSCTFRC